MYVCVCLTITITSSGGGGGGARLHSSYAEGAMFGLLKLDIGGSLSPGAASKAEIPSKAIQNCTFLLCRLFGCMIWTREANDI